MNKNLLNQYLKLVYDVSTVADQVSKELKADYQRPRAKKGTQQRKTDDTRTRESVIYLRDQMMALTNKIVNTPLN